MTIIYERVHGQGNTTDYLHITTDYQDLVLPHKSGAVAKWVYRVHPNTKADFMRKLSDALRRYRVDCIGKQTTNLQDAGMWRLQVDGAGANIIAEIVGRSPDELWSDTDFATMRGFVAEARLMAELYAIRMPESYVEDSR